MMTTWSEQAQQIYDTFRKGRREPNPIAPTGLLDEKPASVVSPNYPALLNAADYIDSLSQRPGIGMLAPTGISNVLRKWAYGDPVNALAYGSAALDLPVDKPIGLALKAGLPAAKAIFPWIIKRKIRGPFIDFQAVDHAGNKIAELSIDRYPESGITGADLSIYRDKEEIPKGLATDLYLHGLEFAKGSNLGWRQDPISSDATRRMYERLSELGIPFQKEGGSHIAYDLSSIDIPAIKQNWRERVMRKPRGDAAHDETVWFRGQIGKTAGNNPFEATAIGAPSFTTDPEIASVYAQNPHAANLYAPWRELPEEADQYSNIQPVRVTGKKLDLRPLQGGHGTETGLTPQAVRKILKMLDIPEHMVDLPWSGKWARGKNAYWDAAESVTPDSRKIVPASSLLDNPEVQGALKEKGYSAAILKGSMTADEFDTSVPWIETKTYNELRAIDPTAMSSVFDRKQTNALVK